MTQMSTKKGLKKHSKKDAEAIVKEFKQLRDKEVFKPRYANSLTPTEKRKALRAITLIKEKRNSEIKGRTFADGRGQSGYTNEDP
jgi:hypothetical protein